MKNKIVGKEIHLKKRPTGFVTEDDFELVNVMIPELKKEGEFLVRNIWISIDPFMRIFMVKGSRIMPPVELNKPLNGGCIGQIIESRSDKIKVGESIGFLRTQTMTDKIVTKVDPKIAPIQYDLLRN